MPLSDNTVDGVLCLRGPERQLVVVTLASIIANNPQNVDDVFERVLLIVDAAMEGSLDGRYDLMIFCATQSPQFSWSWAVKAFKRMPRRYKKQIAALYLVHERTWLRVLMQLMERLVSRKFQRKVHHLGTLEELAHEHPTLYNLVVDSIDLRVWTHDSRLMQDYYEDAELPSDARYTATAKHRPPTPPPKRRQVIVYEDEPDDEGIVLVDNLADEKEEEKPVAAPALPKRPTAKTSDSTVSSDSGARLVNDENVSPRRVQRATSAPTTSTEDVLRPLKTPAKSSTASKSSGTKLRRAISGPLTPSHSKLNTNAFVPVGDKPKPTPKLKAAAHKVQVPSGDGKVNNLRRLFEERLELQQALCQR